MHGCHKNGDGRDDSMPAMSKQADYSLHQEKMMGQRGKLRALAEISHVQESYF